MELPSAWQIEATSLKREYKFKNFRQALALVNAIGAVAETHKHHPDIEFGWGYVRLKITTHDKGNQLTEKDYHLAKAIEELSLPQ